MIAIPNMDKPKRCLECWSGLSIDINCEAGAGFWNANGDRIPPDCPIIDIVRCEECKWAEKEGDESEGYLTCACHIPRFFVPQDGFCFLGERRSE